MLILTLAIVSVSNTNTWQELMLLKEPMLLKELILLKELMLLKAAEKVKQPLPDAGAADERSN